MIKLYRNKQGKKLYPVCSWENNQHKLYNAHDRIMNTICEAQEAGLEPPYEEQERIEKATMVHEVLKAKFRKLFKDKDLIWLLDEIIDSISTCPATEENIEILQRLGVLVDVLIDDDGREGVLRLRRRSYDG